jgi:hypothetical protein
MEYINHITLNTGHIRRSYANEIDKGIYFILRRLLKDSLQPGGTKMSESYILKTTQTPTATIATIFDIENVPMLTTMCSTSTDRDIWEALHDTSTSPLATDRSKLPQVPYIADRLEVGATLHLDALRWTGDFSQCFGWMCLSPGSIKP